ncbi:TPA: hypothetical protein ACN10C_002717 [Staphylococcus aureus]|uniref:hypothetical protein n=1 Tax=Staphylococcus aureus TaxID=1280 RepID=UPI0015EEC5CE|nr:hypothetical protein [Staphylococcus aureus]MBE7589304.1 hypothetical protein [Staphylococcus aureus]MBE7591971.1 hypothetical protein [Staphylococcus aureus]MCE3312154.1 hypothetical protein [Staphylococcus aureus]MCE3381332.1 hypothetical protein [Staphylococcus aureus]MCE3487495.1 hypothetical protein [Staphylococcus aureus]
MGNKRILNITEIENGIKDLIFNLNDREFIIEFLNFYDIPKTSITRAKKSLTKENLLSLKIKFITQKLKVMLYQQLMKLNIKFLLRNLFHVI